MCTPCAMKFSERMHSWPWPMTLTFKMHQDIVQVHLSPHLVSLEFDVFPYKVWKHSNFMFFFQSFASSPEIHCWFISGCYCCLCHLSTRFSQSEDGSYQSMHVSVCDFRKLDANYFLTCSRLNQLEKEKARWFQYFSNINNLLLR